MLFDTLLPPEWQWEPLDLRFRITKKPRGLTLVDDVKIPFIPMEAIPAGGREVQRCELRLPAEIASGNYFERGDILLPKITPSFENLKQGLANDIPGQFGIGSTELIPIQPRDRTDALANQRYLFFYLLHPEVRSTVAAKMEGSTGRQRVPETVIRNLPVPIPPPAEQRKIAAILLRVQQAISIEERLVAVSHELKQTTMQRILTCGLHRNTVSPTANDVVPPGWCTQRLDECCDVVSSSMSYTDFASLLNRSTLGETNAMGLKVSDMNRPGNEIRISSAAVIRNIPANATRKMVPPDTVIFPKRGAAIATNKKRLTTTWTVLDPNLIGVRVRSGISTGFLYHWFQRFDLKTITEPGPTPQLNKKNLVPVIICAPQNPDEQLEIVTILDALDRRVLLHTRKVASLIELFTALLDSLVTGRIRVTDLVVDELAPNAAEGV